MDFKRLPSNSEHILLEIVNADNPAQTLCDLFKNISLRKDDELRGIIRELQQEGYINVKWADNLPFIVFINNSARTYSEQLTRCEKQQPVHINIVQEKKVKNKIFISHRSTDKAIADMLVDFLSGTGIPRDNIFCSSLPGNDINQKISDEIKAALRDSAVNFAILSDDYYQSAYCLNEAGVLWYEDTPVIPITLPEINETKMYGFLNNEYKLRRLDSDTDISAIYDVVSEAISVPQTKVGIITQENNKLRNRYSDFLKIRELPKQNPTSEIVPISSDIATDLDIITDDERIVLYYMLQNSVRKASKSKICDWLNKNEIRDVNIDNAFDLLASSFQGSKIDNEILELDIKFFRQFSVNATSILPNLKECVERHTQLAADRLKRLWKNKEMDIALRLFVAYIIDEKIVFLGTGWKADKQIEAIKQWENQNIFDSTLSDSYERYLDFFIQNNFVFVSGWTSNGNPKECSLCPSLKELLIYNSEMYREDLKKFKNEYQLF